MRVRRGTALRGALTKTSSGRKEEGEVFCFRRPKRELLFSREYGGALAMYRTIFFIFCCVFLTSASLPAQEFESDDLRTVDLQLFIALNNNDLEGVARMIEAGADINLSDESNNTVLHAALDQEYYAIAEHLILSGADVNAVNRSGLTPLHIVRDAGIAELLIEKGGDVHAIEYEYGMTPLFFHGKQIAGLLIEAGADIEARSFKGNTPLGWATYSGDIETVRFLIEKGANVTVEGKTPLHIASNWGFVELADLFIFNGADVNAADSRGWTPLHWASFEGGIEMVIYLIEQGADLSVETTRVWGPFPKGANPYEISKRAKSTDTAQFLKSLMKTEE